MCPCSRGAYNLIPIHTGCGPSIYQYGYRLWIRNGGQLSNFCPGTGLLGSAWPCTNTPGILRQILRHLLLWGWSWELNPNSKTDPLLTASVPTSTGLYVPTAPPTGLRILGWLIGEFCFCYGMIPFRSSAGIQDHPVKRLCLVYNPLALAHSSVLALQLSVRPSLAHTHSHALTLLPSHKLFIVLQVDRRDALS